MCSIGTTSTCVGACGLTSRKATDLSVRNTTSPGMSPATILQNRQSGTPFTPCSSGAAPQTHLRAAPWRSLARRRSLRSRRDRNPWHAPVALLGDDDPDISHLLAVL